MHWNFEYLVIFLDNSGTQRLIIHTSGKWKKSLRISDMEIIKLFLCKKHKNYVHC